MVDLADGQRGGVGADRAGWRVVQLDDRVRCGRVFIKSPAEQDTARDRTLGRVELVDPADADDLKRVPRCCIVPDGRYLHRGRWPWLFSSTPRVQALAEDWNGSSWSIQTLPGLPSHAGAEMLEGVSCPAAQGCVAVGSTDSAEAVALGWNGRAWTTQLALGSRVRGRGYLLHTVSCSSPDACIAGGDRFTEHNPRNVRLWALWNGATWTTPRSRAVAHSQTVDSVSCVSRTDCSALAGNLTLVDIERGANTGLADRPRIEHWNGSAWSSEAFALNDLYSSISCASTIRCVAVGTLLSGGRKPTHPLVAVGL